MNYRDVEGLLAALGIDASYETVRRRVYKFGTEYARPAKKRRHPPLFRMVSDGSPFLSFQVNVSQD